jgi:hypothetical protein
MSKYRGSFANLHERVSADPGRWIELGWPMSHPILRIKEDV